MQHLNFTSALNIWDYEIQVMSWFVLEHIKYDSMLLHELSEGLDQDRQSAFYEGTQIDYLISLGSMALLQLDITAPLPSTPELFISSTSLNTRNIYKAQNRISSECK